VGEWGGKDNGPNAGGGRKRRAVKKSPDAYHKDEARVRLHLKWRSGKGAGRMRGRWGRN